MTAPRPDLVGQTCDLCGSFGLEAHCESPTCPWRRCPRPQCKAFGYPGARMRRSTGAQ